MLHLENLTKTYIRHGEPVHALYHVSMTVSEGEFVAVTGRSGSGKSTLLLTLGGLIRPTSGTVRFAGKDLYSMSERELARYRSHRVGFVLQTFNLIPYLSARENVAVPLVLRNGAGGDPMERADTLLDRLGLARRRDFLPRELSVGQQQRVAIARALANDPEVILADEPTGNLDPGLSEEVMGILGEINAKDGKTIVIVTHDPEQGKRVKKNFVLEEGRAQGD